MNRLFQNYSAFTLRALMSPDEPAAPSGGAIGAAKAEETPIIKAEGATIDGTTHSDLDALYDSDKPPVKEGEAPPVKEGESALKTQEQMDAEAQAIKDLAAKGEKDKADKEAADAKKLEDDKKAKDEADARTKAYAEAKTPEEKKAAYDKLDDAQKRVAFAALSEDDRKALGIAEPPPAEVKYEPPKMPDGVTLDADTMGKAAAILSGLKGPPTQEQFQELANLYANNAIAFANKVAQAQYDKFLETRAEWAKEIQDDPDIGGKNLQQSNGLVALARDHFVDAKDMPAFIKALEITGAGDNRLIFKFMVAVGKAIKDDKLESGDNSPNADETSAAELMYDKS